MWVVACLVCKHPDRFKIETALKRGSPKARVAKDFSISRPTLYDHIREKHEEKDPAKEPISPLQTEPVDPYPNDTQIKHMTNRTERLRFVERMLADRMYRGTESIAKLARLWRGSLGNDAEVHVAQLVAEAARRHKISRGPRDVRKELLIVKLQDLYERCYGSGDYKTALAAIGQLAERDGLKDNQNSLDRAVLVQIVQLIKHEAPHLERRVEEHLAQFEIVVDQAKAVLEGEIPPQMPVLSEVSEQAPPTPRSNEVQSESGIDTGKSSPDSIDAVPSSE